MLTNLPAYPFNHSQRYWIESRLSKRFRFREHAEHELLGTAVEDWNPLDARWRKIIKLSESEWMADHKINGSVLLPAAAFMIMAIEATRRLANPDQEIVAYRIQNATFTTAVVLTSDEDGTELELRLGADYGLVQESRLSLRREFQLFVLAGQEWSLCSRGTVILDYHPKVPQQEGLNSEMNVEPQENLPVRCSKSVESGKLYSSLFIAGMQYGPTFKTLTSVAVSDEDIRARGIVRPSIPATSILHPTMLDGIFQLMFPALQKDRQTHPSAMLPTRIEDLWIDAKEAANSSDALSVQAQVQGSVRGLRHVEFSMVGRNMESGAIMVSTTGFRAAVMAPAVDSQKVTKRLCYNMDLKPTIALLDNSSISTLCGATVEAAEARPCEALLRISAGIYIITALKNEQKLEIPQKPHLLKYAAWMHTLIEKLDTDNLSFSGITWIDVAKNQNLQDQILSELTQNNFPICQLYLKVGSRLSDILHGRLDTLEYLFSDELLTTFYTSQIQNRLSSRLLTYMELSAHQNPDLRIIEVGAGTGGMTKVVIKSLTPDGDSERGTPRFANYTFTDISSSFIQDFKQIFRNSEHRAEFRTLDVRLDPASQGMECGSYDFVFAANVSNSSRSARDIDLLILEMKWQLG